MRRGGAYGVGVLRLPLSPRSPSQAQGLRSLRVAQNDRVEGFLTPPTLKSEGIELE